MDGASKTYNFSDWMKHLWCEILFPAKDIVSLEKGKLSHRLILCFVAITLLFCRLDFSLFEPDETRYAEIPREMLANDEWLVPLLGGEPYLDKPPLLYWLTMLSYKSFGVGVWQARLIPILALFLCLILTYELGKKIIGSVEAFAGTLLLCLCPGFIIMGKLLVLDGLLSMCVLGALLSGLLAIRNTEFSMGWWVASGIFAALGVITKGPIAIVLTAPCFYLITKIDDRFSKPSIKAWGIWFVSSLLIFSPWFIMVAIRRPEFLSHFVWEHHVMRFLEPFDHQRGVFFYVPVLLGGMMPLVFILWPWMKSIQSVLPEQRSTRSKETGFLLLAGFWCVFFFSLSGCKLPTYILPAFPPLALMFGAFLVRNHYLEQKFTRLVAGVCFILLCFSQWIVLPWYADYRSPMVARNIVNDLCKDENQEVACYPRECNALAFYLGRDDFKNFRSKDFDEFREALLSREKTVVFCTHRHALQGLKQLLPDMLEVHQEYRINLKEPGFLPKDLAKKVPKILGETALGLCDIAVIGHKAPETIRTASYKPESVGRKSQTPSKPR